METSIIMITHTALCKISLTTRIFYPSTRCLSSVASEIHWRRPYGRIWFHLLSITWQHSSWLDLGLPSSCSWFSSLFSCIPWTKRSQSLYKNWLRISKTPSSSSKSRRRTEEDRWSFPKTAKFGSMRMTGKAVEVHLIRKTATGARPKRSMRCKPLKSSSTPSSVTGHSLTRQQD